jgi:hypothetical protein
MTLFRLYALTLGVVILLTVRYKLGQYVDRALTHEVTWRDIKCVPGMVITMAMDHVSDFIWHWSTSWLRLLGAAYAHYAVVVERDGKLYALEWNGYAKDIPHKHEPIPIHFGKIYLHPIEDYLRYLYYYYPSNVNIFYPRRRTNLPLRLDWIKEIEKEGYLHCCVLAYRYLAKAGMLSDFDSAIPRMARYTPMMVRRGLLGAGFRERYFSWKK